MSETDAELLARLRDDASKWAKEFRETAISLGYSDMDEDWLTGWFANAIENSDQIRRSWREDWPKRVDDTVEISSGKK